MFLDEQALEVAKRRLAETLAGPAKLDQAAAHLGDFPLAALDGYFDLTITTKAVITAYLEELQAKGIDLVQLPSQSSPRKRGLPRQPAAIDVHHTKPGTLGE